MQYFQDIPQIYQLMHIVHDAILFVNLCTVKTPLYNLKGHPHTCGHK